MVEDANHNTEAVLALVVCVCLCVFCKNVFILKSKFLQARTVEDPWEKFHLESFESEKAIRHRYNPLTEKWKQDEVIVKMEDEPFGNGAMRECFRM